MEGVVGIKVWDGSGLPAITNETPNLVWSLCFRWIGIVFVQHKAMLTHFESFYLPQLSSRQNFLWKGVWATIVTCIWEHRNSIVFNQGVVDVEEIF